jgi:ribosome-binding protein aMBF1 (putative translation factor)
MKETLSVFWGGGFLIHYAYLSVTCLTNQPRQGILSFLLRWRSKNHAAQKYNDGGMKNIVGKRVQEARQKFKPPLSQEALAVRLELDGWKISRGTLSKIEAGIRQVTDIEIMVLARTLKVSPEWLLDKQLFESLWKKPRG